MTSLRRISSGSRRSACPPWGPRTLRMNPAFRRFVRSWSRYGSGMLLPRGDLRALERPLAVVVGQLDEGANAVVTFG